VNLDHPNHCQYQEQISERSGVAGDFETWHWITADHGAFDGPIDDWVVSHEDLYREYVKDWSVVVQAGGNQGMYPCLFSQMFETVYTFEPDPLNFHCLVQNCQAPNIIKMQAALGDVHKMIGMRSCSDSNFGMHKVTAVGTIPQLRIDDLDLPSCGLIQLDIEGYEIFALRGAEETIKKFHPVIAVENASNEIFRFVHSLGYNKKTLSKMDTIFVVGED
jgi:FkbM family methyltransferase